jgi:hypothetical protein
LVVFAGCAEGGESDFVDFSSEVPDSFVEVEVLLFEVLALASKHFIAFVGE